MDFEHSVERDAYLEAQGKSILNACPGSGKTTTIAYKLTLLTKDWEAKHGKFVGIACLSFTNVAKDEINDKYTGFSGRTLPFPHVVSTIDSFVNRYITLPFYYLFREDFPVRPQILEDLNFMNGWRFSHAITVIKDGKTSKKLLKYSYPPSDIDTNLDGTYSCRAKRPALTGEASCIFNAYCDNVKSIQYSNGWLKNSDSTFVALCLLRKHPRLAAILVHRFPYLIIDEAQDTSEIQYAILDELIKGGLRDVELVGDPYQSLYEWREARPDLFWKRQNSGDWRSLRLNNCRRSTQRIVDCYSIMRKSSDSPIISTLKVERQEPVTVLFYKDPNRLLETYKEKSKGYSNRAVLVRGGTHLQMFEAKPSHESMWNMEPCLPHHLILGSFELEDGQVRDAVRRIWKCLPELIEPGCNANRKRELLDNIRDDPEWNGQIVKLLSTLPRFDLSVAEWTEKAKAATCSCLMIRKDIDFALKQGNMRPKHKTPIKEVYRKSANSDLVKTIHQAKGKTYDSVMLVLAASTAGQNICVSNIEQPVDLPDEKKRMIYVAMSRPSYQLFLAISNEYLCTQESIKSILGPNVAIEEVL